LPDGSGGKGFNQLYMSLRGRLARSVVGIVPPREIEDIVQEAYVRVCQVEKRAGIRVPHSYLFRAVRNLALDYVKCAESRLTDSFEEGGEAVERDAGHLDDETYRQAASNEEFALFCDAVRHLPVQCRRAFVLRKVYGYSQREIAVELGLSESTVEKHIALGIKRCMYFMQQFDQEREKGGEYTRQDTARGTIPLKDRRS
jgi:RNA polymerase sigma-70 factor (ECF subfamily)